MFGPQIAYFAPQILMEQDMHAPGGPEGPAIDARGVAFPGTNLYVQLGHGRDYAWSAPRRARTSSTPSPSSSASRAAASRRSIDGLRFHGQCLPIEVLTRTNSWTPNAADQTPAGQRDADRRADEGSAS